MHGWKGARGIVGAGLTANALLRAPLPRLQLLKYAMEARCRKRLRAHRISPLPVRD